MCISFILAAQASMSLVMFEKGWPAYGPVWRMSVPMLSEAISGSASRHETRSSMVRLAPPPVENWTMISLHSAWTAARISSNFSLVPVGLPCSSRAWMWTIAAPAL